MPGFPEGKLDFDPDCPDGCDEGRQFNNADPTCGQYDICDCVVRRGMMQAEQDELNAKANHELKTWPDYFRMLLGGTKLFEIRKYDRNFQPGQMLLLREWNPDTQLYTGREIKKKISFMLTSGMVPGIEKGYCVLGLYDANITKVLEGVKEKVMAIEFMDRNEHGEKVAKNPIKVKGEARDIIVNAITESKHE